jgi:hypothetical protein
MGFPQILPWFAANRPTVALGVTRSIARFAQVLSGT